MSRSALIIVLGTLLLGACGAQTAPAPAATAVAVPTLVPAPVEPTPAQLPTMAPIPTAAAAAPQPEDERMPLIDQTSLELDGGLNAKPVVHDGTVYILLHNGYLQALSAVDLSEQWTFEAEADAFGDTPILGDGAAYFIDYKGNVFAVDLVTGEERWRTTFEVPHTIRYAGGSLIVATWELDKYGAVEASQLRSLDPATGTEQWMIPSDWSYLTPTDSNLLIGSTDDEKTVGAIDTSNGEVVWSFALPEDTAIDQLMVSDGVVFANAKNTSMYFRPSIMLAIDSSNGAELWRRESLTDAVALDDTLYAFTDERVVAIAADTGTDRWDVRVDSSRFMVGDGILLAEKRDALRGFNLSDGKEAWELTSIQDSAALRLVAQGNGKFFLAESAASGIFQVDAATGIAEGKFEDSGSANLDAVTVAEGVLYFPFKSYPSSDLYLYRVY